MFAIFYQLSTKLSIQIDIFMYLTTNIPTYRGELQWYKVLIVLKCPHSPHSDNSPLIEVDLYVK